MSATVDPEPHTPNRAEPIRLIELLRSHTRGIHTELENTLTLDRITRSRSAYAEVLSTFRDILNPLERLLTASPVQSEPDLDLSHRLRHDRLLADLAHFPPIPPRNITLPWSTLSRAEATGVLYVLEGSTLGGQVISTALKQRLEIDAKNGASYFHGHGPDTVTRWRSFLGWANQTLPEQAFPEAGHAAVQTFKLFLENFRR